MIASQCSVWIYSSGNNNFYFVWNESNEKIVKSPLNRFLIRNVNSPALWKRFDRSPKYPFGMIISCLPSFNILQLLTHRARCNRKRVQNVSYVHLFFTYLINPYKMQMYFFFRIQYYKYNLLRMEILETKWREIKSNFYGSKWRLKVIFNLIVNFYYFH